MTILLPKSLVATVSRQYAVMAFELDQLAHIIRVIPHKPNPSRDFFLECWVEKMAAIIAARIADFWLDDDGLTPDSAFRWTLDKDERNGISSVRCGWTNVGATTVFYDGCEPERRLKVWREIHERACRMLEAYRPRLSACVDDETRAGEKEGPLDLPVYDIKLVLPLFS